MKIGQKPELPTPASQAATAKTANKPANGPAAAEITPGLAPRAAGVPVSFSTSARALESSGRTHDDFDASRVKAMREAIANGSFKVDAEAVADKLLSNSQEFLSHSRA